MRIVGRQVNSFIDFPGKIAYVVFTAGCNMDCWYCHNKEVMNSGVFIPEDEILGDILSRKGFIDGVVVTGGEPTLQPELGEFFRKIKRMGLFTKLDTNGTNPEVVRALIDAGLLDYIAMDLKAPLSRYSETACHRVDTGRLEETVALIIGSGVGHEFRTTFTPDLSLRDIEEIAGLADGAKLYVIQAYRQPSVRTHPKAAFKPHGAEFFQKALELARKRVKTVLRT